MEAQLLRVTLLRRLHLLASVAGVLGKRGWALECVAGRICRGGGGRVTTNVLLRDLDLVLPEVGAGDGRRLEVVVDGPPCLVAPTVVCALRTDGQPTTRAAVEDRESQGDESQETQGSHVP